jgi:hypothetical protein
MDCRSKIVVIKVIRALFDGWLPLEWLALAVTGNQRGKNP